MSRDEQVVDEDDAGRVARVRDLIARRRYEIPAIDVADAIIAFHRLVPPPVTERTPDGEES